MITDVNLWLGMPWDLKTGGRKPMSVRLWHSAPLFDDKSPLDKGDFLFPAIRGMYSNCAQWSLVAWCSHFKRLALIWAWAPFILVITWGYRFRVMPTVEWPNPSETTLGLIYAGSWGIGTAWLRPWNVKDEARELLSNFLGNQIQTIWPRWWDSYSPTWNSAWISRTWF